MGSGYDDAAGLAGDAGYAAAGPLRPTPREPAAVRRAPGRHEAALRHLDDAPTMEGLRLGGRPGVRDGQTTRPAKKALFLPIEKRTAQPLRAEVDLGLRWGVCDCQITRPAKKAQFLPIEKPAAQLSKLEPDLGQHRILRHRDCANSERGLDGFHAEACEARADDVAPADECDEAVAKGLAATLEHLALSSAEPPRSTPFHSRWAPTETIAEYAALLHLEFRCSCECLVLAMIYIDRVMKRHAHIVVSLLTCHRLLAASLTIAAKFQDDDCLENGHYAEACGVSLSELNDLERTLLGLLGYRLAVHPTEFELYRRILFQAGGGRARGK